jgi:alpha-glucoside transport system substrate-binding protein
MLNRSMVMLLVLSAVVAGLIGCQRSRLEGALSGKTIEVIAYWNGGEQESFTKVLHLFEQTTGAHVRYVAGGDDLSTLLQTRIKGGNPPNVAISPHPGVVEQLARSGALEPLDPAVANLVDLNYDREWKDLGTVDGKLYSVYFKADNKSTFWYNDRILSENNLKEPENWDEFIDLCTSLSNLGIEPVSVGGADGWVLSDWFENVYLRMHGQGMYEALSDHSIPWTHVSVRQTFEKLREFFGQETFIAGGSAGALQTNYQDSVLDVFGPQARAAMVYEGDFVAGVIKGKTRATVGKDAKFFGFPMIPVDPESASTVVGGDAAMAFKGDAATVEFMKFLASPQAGAEWAKRGGFLSPNRLMSLDLYPDAVTREMARPLVRPENGVRFDMSDQYPGQFGSTKGAGVWKGMQDFLANPDDIDAIMDRLDKEAKEAMS